MARHTEILHDPKSPEGARFCLDRVENDGRIEYAFVWRGTKASPDGFQARPAYFDWDSLGRTIRLSFADGAIPTDDQQAFLRALLGI